MVGSIIPTNPSKETLVPGDVPWSLPGVVLAACSSSFLQSLVFPSRKAFAMSMSSLLWPLMRKILLSSRLVKLVIAEACFKSRELVELVDAEGYLAKGDLRGWIRCDSVTLKGRQSNLLSLWFIKNEDLGDVFKDRLA
ncbi:hypothetical protein BKA58DRAFT_466876 [Alternaria rosae]|uniref:uncharacterized protein n=1 Tax=Alternaria rosae TaxID=1187941 RepID=UPI001E8DE2BF|nr:uncharacterized protein BKA58DRAFT_466876 [Alternaria rosae]KAH6879309.1 hypothetical protein BKA58DRAFT_466876 [Alternaria rosae]